MSNFLSVLSEFPATGHVFIVSGKTSFNAQKFNVTFMCGKAGNSDIALMLFCNFGDGKVARASLVNGIWNETEDSMKISNPVKKGEEFTFYVLVGDDRFHVSINGEAFCTYNFKIPAKEIKAISVSGDVENLTQVDHRLAFPSIYPLVNNDTPDVTFSGIIPRKLKPGHVSIISGVVTGNPQGEFVVFFLENDSNRQLIHFNPRFDQQDVVINTMHGYDDESWGDSEVHSGPGRFPFYLNQPFKLALAFSENDFKVAVNGQYLMSFGLDNIDLEDDESLWDILTGFQIKVGSDLKVRVSYVEHIQGDEDCGGFENFSIMNAY